MLKQMKVPTTIARLDTGDYFVNDVPITRKGQDFISSLVSGHLDAELYALSHSYDRSIFILEGATPSTILMESGIARQAYLSKLAGIPIRAAPDGKMGLISVIPTETKWDTAILLKSFNDKFQDGRPRLPQMTRFVPGQEDILVYILSSFPSIGPIRAKKLLSKFSGFDELIAASEDDIAETIGEKTAAEFYTQLHRKVKSPV